MPDKVIKPAFDWSTLNLQAVLLAAGFVIMVLISAFTVFVIDRAADDADDLTRTLNIQDRLTTSLLAMRRAESGQRGYLLTKQEVYLQDYIFSAPRVLPVVKELRDLAVDDPALIRQPSR